MLGFFVSSTSTRVPIADSHLFIHRMSHIRIGWLLSLLVDRKLQFKKEKFKSSNYIIGPQLLWWNHMLVFLTEPTCVCTIDFFLGLVGSCSTDMVTDYVNRNFGNKSTHLSKGFFQLGLALNFAGLLASRGKVFRVQTWTCNGCFWGRIAFTLFFLLHCPIRSRSVALQRLSLNELTQVIYCAGPRE